MTIRSHLRDQIDAAWFNTVSKHYENQRINSEASLQASLWSSLNDILSVQNPNDRRLFVEPSIRIKGEVDGKTTRERRYPDLAVCSKTQIIAIIELKYAPRGEPSVVRDLEKFTWFSARSDLISISNNRYHGDIDQVYKMSKNVLYVWCGIYKKLEANDFQSQLPNTLLHKLYTKHHCTSKTSANGA